MNQQIAVVVASELKLKQRHNNIKIWAITLLYSVFTLSSWIMLWDFKKQTETVTAFPIASTMTEGKSFVLRRVLSHSREFPCFPRFVALSCFYLTFFWWVHIKWGITREITTVSTMFVIAIYVCRRQRPCYKNRIRSTCSLFFETEKYPWIFIAHFIALIIIIIPLVFYIIEKGTRPTETTRGLQNACQVSSH